jgi:hypothetical protein
VSALELSPATWQVLRDRVEDAAGDLGALRTYSGRGMYGRECVGLVVHNVGELLRFVLDLGYLEAEYDGINDEVSQRVWNDVNALVSSLAAGGLTTAQDGMGRDTIYYWPSVEVKSTD